MAGEVLVNGQLADKPGTLVAADAHLELKQGARFASRGGDKLEAALLAFGIEVGGRACADVGASTGGFTDCLLQRGAAKVYALDVGQGILDWRLRNDPRVMVMEGVNARYVGALPETVWLVTMDASFISTKLLIPVAGSWLAPGGEMVILIKPQFEAGRERVGKRGVVRDPVVHREVLTDVLAFAAERGWHTHGLIRSPLLGPAGNVEFLAWLKRPPPAAPPDLVISNAMGDQPQA